MQEVYSMRAIGFALALCVVMFFISSNSFANGAIRKGRGADIAIKGGSAAGPASTPQKIRPRSARSSCRIVHKGQKPLSATLEDCVAYALDIPLAMMTPFVTAITPVMDKLDCGWDNHYSRALK
jgi:hypothetical protein